MGYAREAIALREALKAQCLNADASARVDNPMAELQLVSDDRRATASGRRIHPNKDKAAIGENILGLRLLCLYGLKGAAAYMEHAHVLGQYDNAIYAQYHKIMAWLGTAFRHERPAGMLDGNRPDELQSDEYSGCR